MAVRSTTLKISIRETCTLNNNKYDSTFNHSISGINEISKRVVTVPTSSQEIVGISGSIGSGTFITENVQYMRFSNLNDNSGSIALTFRSDLPGDTKPFDEFQIKLDHGQSFIYPGSKKFGVSGSMDAIDLNSIVPQGGLYKLSSLKTVVAESIDHGQTEIVDDVEVTIPRVPVDLEIFIASK